jgi:lysophospholipase L1-like esterase
VRARLVRSRLGRVLAVGLLVVAAVVAAGFWLRVERPGPAVAIVGDSITAWGAGPLEERLGVAWDLRIEAVAGHTVADQLGAARTLADEQPPAAQLVVNLGTNDALLAVPTASSLDALAQMLDAYPDVRCIHLVTVTDRWRQRGTREPWPEARALNEGLRTFGTDPRVRIVDWAARLEAADADGTSLLLDDVHPNDAGNVVLADLIGASLATCPVPRVSG